MGMITEQEALDASRRPAYNAKRLIKEKGLQVGYVAQRAGYTQSTFSKLLNCRKKFNAIDYLKLAEVLNVSTSEFFEPIKN